MSTTIGSLNVLIDGQYGSTGKGAVVQAMLEAGAFKNTQVAATNCSPNAGHSFFLGEKKVYTKHVPVLAALKKDTHVIFTAGSIINPDTLERELEQFDIDPLRVVVHPHAAIVTSDDLVDEGHNQTLRDLGSTLQGTGHAYANRALRRHASVAKNCPQLLDRGLVAFSPDQLVLGRMYQDQDVLMEVPQGRGLGLYSGYYPFTTCREVSVAQALADAQVPPHLLSHTIMVFRLHPIRVGGNSGPFPIDSEELTWDELGQEPETTTVTGKIRRIATWSRSLCIESIKANMPSLCVLNFGNYARSFEELMRALEDIADAMSVYTPPKIIVGWGPTEFTFNPDDTMNEVTRRFGFGETKLS